ncbi:MAG TPA: transcription termination factor Rho [Stackebrandtia sp.]|uniref:transcription termination factor Rho n=1 Tax=Stackebrandtia sp. TaxID=2023065 RepID=UPI002D7240C6|nr:transcription termination factor Rho [Stackebrandtia sp.]HZE39203.1 transcription termination factor Rho [Stackebrandtia sp.]
MSDTTGNTPESDSGATTATSTRRRRAGAGLAGMLMPELQQLANSLGIPSIGRMRKSELITAIQARQSGDSAQPTLPVAETDAASKNGSSKRDEDSTAPARRATRAAGPPQPRRSAVVAAETETATQASTTVAVEDRDDARDDASEAKDASDRGERRQRRERSRPNANGGNDKDAEAKKSERGGEQRSSDRQQQNQRGGGNDEGRRNRRHRDRGRDRDRDRDRGDRSDRSDRGDRGDRGRGGRDRGEPQVNEDDVLVPVAGIVDILDNYAFLRTSGYLAGSTDVYVSMSQVRKHGLRRGDAVTGMVKAPKEDGDNANNNNNSGKQRREKYNPLMRLDTVNGTEPDQARKRPDFYKLTPLYPQQRLRLETEPHLLTTRVIDLVTPVGKGQRALIVSPPKAGKTMVLQAIANAITANNPECHLMVVLVDERPEEVTDMQRSVKGEVISSTFDRHPSDHTTVAELSIERAKRLVELGHDVVVLLDSITRLGRAYNNATPASGRILSGGIDSTALYPPKKFLGAARNIENGGSLTIIATALVETGSMGDTVIFEEFKGTGNSELRLDRKIADKRTFPAVDVHQSSTRKDDLMMGPDETAIMVKLRRVLASLEPQQAIDLLLDRLKKNKTNAEFLMGIAKTTPNVVD